MRGYVIGALIWTGLAGAALAGDAVVPRYVEFRDGSVLRLPIVDEEWKMTVLRRDGTIEPISVRLSTIQRLVLTPERWFEQKRLLLSRVQQLGADDFDVREQAQAALLKAGGGIRPDLETALEAAEDVEVKHRLKKILHLLPEHSGKQARAEAPFDTFYTKESLRGDAGEGRIAVQIDAETRRLNRRDVLSLSLHAPEIAELEISRSAQSGFRRIESKDYPQGCLEEPFETAPNGRKLVIGENVEKVFISKGFVLSTSITDSFVSVNNYRVDGKSGGMSAATHQPLFHGEITIRFCKPGQEHVPATVTHFGTYIAAVQPKGTALIAYDLAGKELGTIHTEKGPTDFLGVRSAVPIHRIRIVPNLQIDPDYTLDDFIYTVPRTTEGGHPEKCVVQFTDGERVLCADVSFSASNVRMHGLPAGLPDRSRPLVELVRVVAPEKGRQDRPTPPGVLVELRDGSVVYGAAAATKKGPLVFPRRPATLNNPDDIVGLWNTAQGRALWPDKTTPAVLWDETKRTWNKVTDVVLAEEKVTWVAGGKALERPYADMPPLLLRVPTGEAKPGSWRLRTVQGEDILLSEDRPPELAGKVSGEVTTAWKGTPLKIAAADLVSISRVQK